MRVLGAKEGVGLCLFALLSFAQLVDFAESESVAKLEDVEVGLLLVGAAEFGHVLDEAVDPINGDEAVFEAMVEVGVGMDGDGFFMKTRRDEIFVKIGGVAAEFVPFWVLVLFVLCVCLVLLLTFYC